LRRRRLALVTADAPGSVIASAFVADIVGCAFVQPIVQAVAVVKPLIKAVAVVQAVAVPVTVIAALESDSSYRRHHSREPFVRRHLWRAEPVSGREHGGQRRHEQRPNGYDAADST
jgi:hypothetical protein